MKRREFIKQSLSASAVMAGAGYASLDMFRHKVSYIPKPLADRADKAAAKVLDSKNPAVDEGILQPSAQISPDIAAPAEPIAHARPAVAYEQIATEATVDQSFEKIVEHAVDKVVVVEEFGVETSASDKVAIATPQESAKSVQEKVANFETNFTDDIILSEADFAQMVQSLERINRVQDYVGFGNFNVLSFDEALKYAKYSPRIGEFTQAEKDFLEMLFNYDSGRLGFFGEKVVGKQTNVIASKDVVKMPGTGHYVFKGHSEAFYGKIRKEVGDSLILTSGVRNIVKQYQLFMAKAVHAGGNLSRASRSLAPPGHSYHAIGDFDVGQVGAGLKNFTADFAQTDEFKRLQDLGYVRIRYTADNNLGVRYEPWHIRVV